jgi:hypothetical protein
LRSDCFRPRLGVRLAEFALGMTHRRAKRRREISGRAAGGRDELTPTERQIADLVGRAGGAREPGY